MTHIKINNIEDKESGEPRLSHRIDMSTGMYNGRQILKQKLNLRANCITRQLTIAIDAMGVENSLGMKGLKKFFQQIIRM